MRNLENLLQKAGEPPTQLPKSDILVSTPKKVYNDTQYTPTEGKNEFDQTLHTLGLKKDFFNLTMQIINYSNWDDLQSFDSLCKQWDDKHSNIRDDATELELLKNSNIIIGQSLQAFSRDAAKCVSLINAVDYATREYIFNYMGDEEAIKKMIGKLDDVEKKDAAGKFLIIPAAAEFAIKAVYGPDMSAYDKTLTAHGINTQGIRKNAGILEQYKSLANALLEEGAIKGNLERARQKNSSAADELVSGFAAVNVLPDQVFNLNGPEAAYLYRRSVYNMETILKGISLINNKELPISQLNLNATPAYESAVQYLAAFRTEYTNLNNLFGSANGLSQNVFNMQLIPILGRLLDYKQQLLAGMNVGGADMSGITHITQGLDWLSQNQNQIWGILQNPEQNATGSVSMANAAFSIDTGINEISNSIYGANPLRDLFSANKGKSNAVMHELMGQEKLLKKIFPDISVVDYSTRLQILNSTAEYAMTVYGYPGTQEEKKAKLGAFFSSMAQYDLNTDNFVANFTNEQIGVSDKGIIYIKPSAITGINEYLISPYDNVFGFLRDQFGRHLFGPFDEPYPITTIGQTFQSSMPYQLEESRRELYSFKNRQWTRDGFARLFLRGLEREYYTDITFAQRALDESLEGALGRGFPRMGGVGSLDGTLAGGNTFDNAQHKGITGEGVWNSINPLSNASGGVISTTSENAGTDSTNQQAYAEIQNSKLPLIGGALIRNLQYNLQATQQESQSYKAVNENVVAQLNSSPYAQSSLLMHYDWHSTGSQAQTSETSNYMDDLHVYWRMAGTTWVELILTDDVRKALYTTSQDSIEKVGNIFSRIGSYDEGAFQGSVGIQQRIYDVPLGQENVAGTHTGFYAALGSDALGKSIKFAGINAQTVQRERAEAVQASGEKYEVKIGWYTLNENKLSNLTGTGTGNIFQQNYGDMETISKVEGELAQGAQNQIGIASTSARKEFENERILAATIALSDHNGNSHFGGANIGYQSGEYTRQKGETGLLARGYGFGSWRVDETQTGEGQKLDSFVGGFEGKYLATTMRSQYRKYEEGYNRYTTNLQTKLGTADMEVMANWSDPSQNSAYSLFVPQNLDLTALKSAYGAYQEVLNTPASTEVEKKAALYTVSEAMKSSFMGADNYSLLNQLAGGSIRDFTMKIRSEDGTPGMMLSFSQTPGVEGGKKRNIVSTMIDLKDNFSVVASFDLGEDEKLKNTNLGVGAIWKLDNFKLLLFAEKLPPNSPIGKGGIATEGGVAWGPIMVNGVYVDSDLWKVTFTHAGRTYNYMLNFTKQAGYGEDEGAPLYTGGFKGEKYFGQFRACLGLGLSQYEQIRSATAQGEFGVIGSIVGKPGYFGFGVVDEWIYEPTKKNDYFIYGKITRSF